MKYLALRSISRSVGLLLSELGNQGPLVLDACSLLPALDALLLLFASAACFLFFVDL